MEYRKGFNKKQFEQDHFVHRRGSFEKVFDGWSDVRYHFGLTSYSCNEHDLEDGNMSKSLYDNLCHVYGEEAMSRYFPKEKEKEKPKPMLHIGVGSAMAALVDGKKPDTMPSGVMTEAEIDALAELM